MKLAENRSERSHAHGRRHKTQMSHSGRGGGFIDAVPQATGSAAATALGTLPAKSGGFGGGDRIQATMVFEKLS